MHTYIDFVSVRIQVASSVSDFKSYSLDATALQVVVFTLLL